MVYLKYSKIETYPNEVLDGFMVKTKNDLDIYYAVGNANTSRQETEIGKIIKKRNSMGWKLVSTSTAIVDSSNQFSNLYLFWEKQHE